MRDTIPRFTLSSEWSDLPSFGRVRIAFCKLRGAASGTALKMANQNTWPIAGACRYPSFTLTFTPPEGKGTDHVREDGPLIFSTEWYTAAYK